jgi:formate--tetrahydrofolate ligase
LKFALNQKKNGFKFLYSAEIPLLKKVEAIAKEIYGAGEVVADSIIKNQLNKMEKDGFGKFPICIAKTQYSFSTDPKLKGAPTGHKLQQRKCNRWF